jgi:PAS domain S-box-containing protein
MSQDTAEEGRAAARTRIVISAAAVVLVLVVVLGIGLVIAFVDRERQRDVQQWQVRLGIVADSRTAEVNRWLDEQFGTMQSLAENASLQLYMTEISLGGSNAQDAEAEVGYLRNLLNATAARDGFVPTRIDPTVGANVERAGQAGIALVSADGRLLVATDTMPALTPRLQRALERAAQGQPELVDIYAGPDGGPAIGFVTPVYGVQADAGSSRNIGFVVGVRPVGGDLYDRLQQPGETARSAESYLVRRFEQSIEYLSPLADGSKPLAKRLAADTPELAAAFALEKPGGFATRRDYAGKEVLVTGRAVARAPWFLVRKVDTAEALEETDRRQTTLLTTFILVIIGVAVAIIAVWRHGTSVRAAQAAERFRIANERLENFSKFLRVVTDGQPNAVFAVDEEGRYTFANEQAAEGTGIANEEMLGKTMASVIGPVRAKLYQDINAEIFRTEQPSERMHTFEEAGGTRTVVTNHIPLRADRDHPRGVLVIVQDITDAVSERARRERTMRALVSTLVGLVDRRDPYSADQSQRVAEVATAVAGEMAEAEAVERTVDIAGNLMNLGKILVPPEVLTKTSGLTEAEFNLVRESLLHTADMVEQVNFDLPVAETIRHLQERWDGTGYPAGLTGEQISVGARIIAVANAFVSMVSPRAYRDALSFDEALAQLGNDAGTRFDRRPVSALTNIIDNRGGRERWAHFRARPEGTEESAG